MKKTLVLLLVLIVCLSGCAPQSQVNDALIKEQKQVIVAQQIEISELENKKRNLQAMIVDLKAGKGIAQYVLTLEVGQSHFTLDFTKQIKDAMNRIELEFPVTKEFYDEVEIGDVIDDSFRTGSFWMEGSIGSWDIKIVGKEIR